MGLHALKTRKIRLAFAVLLSFCSFSLFTISVAMYDYSPANGIYNSLRNESNKTFEISSKAKNPADPTILISNPITEESKVSFENKFNITSDGIFEHPTSSDSFESFLKEPLPLYNNQMASLNSERMAELNFSLMGGQLPAQIDEVALSDLFFYIFDNFGFVDYSNNLFPHIYSANEINSPEDIIGKTVKYSDDSFKVSGFIDTSLVSENSKEVEYFLSDNAIDLMEEAGLDYDFVNYKINYGYANKVYCSTALFDNIKSGNQIKELEKGAYLS